MYHVCRPKTVIIVARVRVSFARVLDPYHTEPFKALQDWTDHLDRMNELNKLFPGEHPAYYEPKKPLPLLQRRAASTPPPALRAYNNPGTTKNDLKLQSFTWPNQI